MSVSPENAIIVGAATICFILVLLVILLVRRLDRDRVRIDPMQAAHGDYPGFTREQLERFQSDIHGERLHKTGGVF